MYILLQKGRNVETKEQSSMSASPRRVVTSVTSRLTDLAAAAGTEPRQLALLSDKLLAELCKENKLSLTDRVNIEAYVARVRAEKLSVGEVLPARIGWKRSQGVQGPGPLHDISQRRQIRLLHSWLPSRPKPGAATSLTFCMQRTRALVGTCSRACS